MYTVCLLQGVKHGPVCLTVLLDLAITDQFVNVSFKLLLHGRSPLSVRLYLWGAVSSFGPLVVEVIGLLAVVSTTVAWPEVSVLPLSVSLSIVALPVSIIIVSAVFVV